MTGLARNAAKAPTNAAIRQAQGERIRGARLRWGLVGVPHAAHLWIPAFAGTTVGGLGECGRRRRPRATPLPWVPAKAGTTRGVGVSGPHCPAPLDTGFRRYDGGGVGGDARPAPPSPVLYKDGDGPGVPRPCPGFPPESGNDGGARTGGEKLTLVTYMYYSAGA